MIAIVRRDPISDGDRFQQNPSNLVELSAFGDYDLTADQSFDDSTPMSQDG
jgi:hypothetical protein